MAFSFELGLVISSELYGAILAGPEHHPPEGLMAPLTTVALPRDGVAKIP